MLIGLLVTRNEEDIIEEVLNEYKKHFDAILAFDMSDDRTGEIIQSFDIVKYYTDCEKSGIPREFLRDGVRQLLLARAQEMHSYDGWIFSLQGDEIFHGEVKEIVEIAETEKANLINCLVANFLIHTSERVSICFEDPKRSIQERRLWYFFSLPENAGFKNQRGLYFLWFEHKRIIPYGAQWKLCSKLIIRKHYPFRTPEQARKRIEDRVASGWQDNYRDIESVFIDDPQVICKQGKILSPIQKFDGTFRLGGKYKDFETNVIQL